MSPQLPYRTPLTPEQEAEFQRYVQIAGRRDVSPQDKQAEANFPDSDYDVRGAWLAAKKGLDAGGNWDQGQDPLTAPSGDGTIHGSDVFKTPYHNTFSNESKYAAPRQSAPAWSQNSQLQTQGALQNPFSPTLRQGVSTISDESQFGRNLAAQKLLGSKLIPQHAHGGVIAPQGTKSMSDHWIAGAVQHPGAFSAKAKHAGESTGQYAAQEQHAPGALGHQARLARTLMGMPHHADGGMISGPQQQPGTMDRLSALWHSLFAKNQLDQAGTQGTQAPPPAPPPEAQNTNIVAQAAADAGRRMEAAKAAQSRQPR